MDQPSIFQFTALESFLGSAFQHRKALNPSYSYALWARRLGVRSAATLCMITHGQRSPGKSLAEKLKRELALGRDESRYFDILVGLKRSRNQVVPSLRLMQELEKRHPTKGFRLIDHDQFKTMANWYYWCLLEWMNLKSFKEDPEWLASHMEFPVSPAQIREALIVLERLNLVGRNRQGKLVRSSKILTTPTDVANEAIQGFHEESLVNAARSIRKHSVQERDMQCLTLALRPQQLAQAKKVLGAFLDDFCRTFDHPQGKRVYQLQTALFPLTVDPKESK